MTRHRWTAVLLLAVVTLVTTACGQMRMSPTHAPTSARATGTAVVEEVHDGDTFRLRGLGRVRAIGIDTPELAVERRCFGDQETATQFAKRVLEGEEVKYTVGTEPRDRYGRLLVYLELEGVSFNELVLQDGFGWPLVVPPNTECAALYQRLADQARSQGRGLWAHCPQRPPRS